MSGNYLNFVKKFNVQRQTENEFIYFEILCVHPKPDILFLGAVEEAVVDVFLIVFGAQCSYMAQKHTIY